METIILSVIILLICVVLLGVKVLFIKGVEFPSGHIHSSAPLRKRGISCASGLDTPPYHTVKTIQKNKPKNI